MSAAAAPMDGLSLSDEACLSQLRQRLQRDVNCLSDPDRSTRRRALTKLQKAMFQGAKVRQLCWSVGLTYMLIYVPYIT